MNARKKLDKLCKEQLCNEVKTYDEALDFLREFTCVYDKCKSDKEYVPGLSHYDFMYWVNPIREAFAENDYKKADWHIYGAERLFVSIKSKKFNNDIVATICKLRKGKMMNSNVCTANQKNYNQAMEYVNLTLERDTATKADNLLFLKFMIDCIGRDIETDINKNVAKNDFRYALLFKLSKMYFELLNS